MYMNVRSGRDVLTDPNAGTFGELGSTAEDIASALIPCAGSVLGGAQAIGDCIWNAIQGYVLSMPDSQAALTALQSMDCASALAFLGVPSSTASQVCGAVNLITGGTAWTYVQQKAQQMLGVASTEAYQTMYGRGRDRSAAEGGGHTLVNESGNVVGVVCPGYLQPLYDPSGTMIGEAVYQESRIDPSAICPQAVAGPTAPQILVARPREMYRPSGPAPGRITGRVVDAGGAPVFGAEIRVGSLRNPVATRTDATGAFAVTTTPTTVTHVYVSAKGYAPVHVTVPLTSGGEVDAGSIVVGTAGGPGDQGNGLVVAKSWYKRTSTWLVVGGVLIVGGGIAVAVARRGRGR